MVDGVRLADTMDTNDSNRSLWRFIDGSLSVSASMLIAAVIGSCESCSVLWGIEYLKALTGQEDGVIIVATLLLFPATLALYGVLQMWFAAKEAVEKRAAERGRQKGRREGRQEERERISKTLAEHGVELPPEVASILSDESDSNRRAR